MKRTSAVLCLALLTACSSSSTTNNAANNARADAGHDAATDGGRDARADATDAGCHSPYATGPGAGAAQWCEVDQVLSESLASADAGTAQLPGFEFQVVTFDATKGEPVLRYSRAEGTVAGAPANVAAPLRTASAAKLMTALLIARAAAFAKAAGDASLTPSATIDALGCSGLPAGVAGTTLDDLMHQTAGLTAATENACVTKVGPLHNCACSILQNDYVATQDGTFAYTPHNFVVAAALADAVLRKLSTPTTLRAVFGTWLAEMGISASEARLPIGNDFAGGDRISARAYAKLLALALPGPARGSYHGKQLLDPAILDRLPTPYGDKVAITYSPYVEAAGLPMRYGFGDWVQCSQAWPEPAKWPAPDKPVFKLDYAACPYRAVNSLGKFGYMPWFIERSTRPYAAVLAVDLGGGTGRVSTYSFVAYEMLDPVVRAAIDGAAG